MKSCQTCKRIYPDQNLTFCVDDGTPLTNEDPTENAYVPPGTYVPSPVKERRVWPWVAGIGGAFLLGVVSLMIVAALLVPRRAQQPPAVVTVDEPQPEPEEIVDTPAPTDQEQVLAQLTDLENEWTVANLNADKQKLARILADDYVSLNSRSRRLEGKKEYIATIERDTQIEKWEFAELRVYLAGNRATLTGKITYMGGGQSEEFDFIDRFVWRNGRWQATGSEVQRRQAADVNNH